MKLLLSDKNKRRLLSGVVMLPVALMIAGCSFHRPRTVEANFPKNQIRLIAVMPLENQTKDAAAPPLFRKKMLEELYYKGYPKIPFELLDTELNKLAGDAEAAPKEKPASQEIGKALKVDALMYCTLKESQTSLHFFHASTSLSATCELRSATTGEILWRGGDREVERSFGYSPFITKLNAVEVYEEVMRNVVNKIVGTLPDSPDLAG